MPTASRSTTHEARTQLILMLIAIAVGGAVFVLAGDFVIGVGAGAAVFAVVRQVMKVWGRTGDRKAGIARP